MMDWYGGMGAGSWVFMVLFWVVLVALIVWAIVRLSPRAGGDGLREPDDAQAILDRRLARGEIDPETYATLRDTIRDGRAVRG